MEVAALLQCVSGSALVSSGCVTNTMVWVASTTDVHRLAVLEAGRPRSRCGQHWFPLRPLSLAWRRPSLPCVLTQSFLSARLCPNLLSLQGDQSHWMRATLGPHFYLITSLKALSPNTVIQSHPEIPGLRASLPCPWP